MVTYQTFKSIFKKCIDDRCPQIAASLAYATLLALIPLTVLVYKIVSTVFIDPALQLKVQAFVFDSLSPATTLQVQQYLIERALQVNSLNIIALFTLLISVIVMMYTIDSAINSIWKTTVSRHFMRRIFVYLALLICGPLAVTFSLFVSAYIASVPFISSLLGDSVENGLFNWLPFVILWAAFAVLYKWIPNCKVKGLHALYGATFAACLFEIAKGGFILYVSYFPLYDLLYGALAAIPLLLIWIYLSWLIVLIGAEITHFMEIAE